MALFAFRRQDHLAATLATLRSADLADRTDLFVFCDGARNKEEFPQVEAVRSLAHSASGFRSVTVIERERNLGLAASVITGVGHVLTLCERVIVIEDDMLVSRDFLSYLNEGLELYENEPRVVSIHAFCVVSDHPLPQSFFLRGADCWGWATWRRGWQVFDADGESLLSRLDASRLAGRFDYDGAYPYRQMLVDQVSGCVDSWAIRWHASAFLADLLTLYPGRSLVRNIGQDGSGTHSGTSPSHQVPAQRMDLPLRRIAIQESAEGWAAVARTLGRGKGSGLRVRLGRLLKGSWA